MQDLRVLNLSRRKKNIILLLVDISIIMLVYATLALLNIEDINLTTGIWINIGIAIITYVFLLKVNNMYSCIWVNAGAYEFTQTIVASISACIVVTWITLIIPNTMSVLSNILAGILIMVALTGVRLSLRVLTRIVTYSLADRTDGKYNILIIGAGDCASTIISEIRKEKSNDYNIIGIIDDNKAKLNTLLNGVKVLGNRDNIVEIVERENIDQILFAIAKIDGEAKSKILDICSKTTAKVKVIPGYYQLLEEGISVNKMRDVDLRDLIGREEVKLDKSGIEKYINNKIVLVTGGGGSIGSELCRQIAKFNPKLLLILDIYENNAYDLQNELSYNEPNLNKKVIIASVRDKARLGQIISAYKPNIIFHAAAHKHVPLMEDNPSEAIKNNVIGTLNMAQLASQYKVEKFVLISTDKAVNPTNVMGATKRLCEMIVQAVNNERGNKTEFVAVRFGNVLGSNGSVIPLFKRQIKNGGPLTLTHKDITRYFMLIPEAAQLVLQAGAYAKGGEIFVLDMGKPVKIYDLAENLIRLSGYTPNSDIKIEITGLRPGEKLYEELLMNNDNLTKTAHNKIFIDKPETIPLNKIIKQIDDLLFVAKIGNKNMLKDKLKEIVPTYNSPEFYNNKRALEEAAITIGGNNNGSIKK
ncbi:nucleoside-diphosphate sugar epimerase/dehydratase [uncultured Clostridium sp.]|uniref:polysaccharide biosynthesis protein n=2 Tax=uncultured Clostridium sp. TaxID=59620 RepID=UPI0025DF24AE|nr:nucleoside-diphosphate sugar epimerase/dehydratase [uncultured Clostridium sp.]